MEWEWQRNWIQKESIKLTQINAEVVDIYCAKRLRSHLI